MSSIVEKFKEAVELVDLNRDGIPDVQQSWLIDLAWHGALHLARTHLADAHPVRIGMETAELVRSKVAAAAAGELPGQTVEAQP